MPVQSMVLAVVGMLTYHLAIFRRSEELHFFLSLPCLSALFIFYHLHVYDRKWRLPRRRRLIYFFFIDILEFFLTRLLPPTCEVKLECIHPLSNLLEMGIGENVAISCTINGPPRFQRLRTNASVVSEN